MGAAISQSLTQFGFDVFLDYTGLASGDFESVILENIHSRAHFVVVLTPSALERCGDPNDLLRREVEAGLDSRRNIVPLMLEGFDFTTPTIANQLTGTLAALKQYNAMTVPPEYFDAAMSKLREKFLNVPLDAVLHPASLTARQAASHQKDEAARAPRVAEEELTAQQWFERGFNATGPDEQIRFNSEAIRLEPDFAEPTTTAASPTTTTATSTSPSPTSTSAFASSPITPPFATGVWLSRQTATWMAHSQTSMRPSASSPTMLVT